MAIQNTITIIVVMPLPPKHQRDLALICQRMDLSCQNFANRLR